MERSRASNRRSITIAVVVAIVMSLVPLLPALAEPGTVTAFTVDSEPGELMGNGRSVTFTPPDGGVAAYVGYYGHGIGFDAGNATEGFSTLGWPPEGTEWTPGTFSVSRSPSPSTAGLYVAANGYGCTSTSGTLTVYEVAFDGEGFVETFAASYEQYCDGNPAALFGEIRYHSSFEYAAAATHPSSIDLGRVGVSFGKPASVEVTNIGIIPLDLGQAFLTGPASGDYEVTTDACSGTSLAPAAACEIALRFTPSGVGSRLATLILPDSTHRGERAVPLLGEGFKSAGDVTLTVSSHRITFGKNVRLTAHLNDFEHTLSKKVTIFATPYGGSKRVIASGAVNGSGNLTTSFTMRKKTTFVARFAGDAAFTSDSSLALVEVRPIAKASLSGHNGTSGRYRLYRYTSACTRSGDGCPTYTMTLVPQHAGKTVYGTLQLYSGGRWRTSLDFRMRLNSKSKARTIFVYADRRIVGLGARVRFHFAGDADHLEATSSWSYFKVTN